MKNKHKLKKLIICILCVICTLVTFTPVNTNAATKVALSNTKITLKLGNTKVLKLKNAKGKVTWKTSNTKVVSIKKKDATSITLTPKKQGNVTITATNNKKTYTCKVNVPKLKYDTWDDETVMLGYTNTVTISDVHTPIQWSIDNKEIASIKAKGKNNYKVEITSLTHGETTIHAILNGTIYDMKVIVPEVKLDVAKMVWDGSKYYINNYLGPTRYDIRTYYDENGNDITNTFKLFCEYENNGVTYLDSSKGQMVLRSKDASEYNNEWLDVHFIGTDISTAKVEWVSSNPEKVTIEKGEYYSHEVGACKGSVTFTTKLGNETFSYVFEYEDCELPK